MWQVGSKTKRGKKTKQNKKDTKPTKKPRTVYKQRQNIWQEVLDILSGNIYLSLSSSKCYFEYWTNLVLANYRSQQQMKPILQHEGQWERNRLLFTVQLFQLISFRIGFQLMTTSEIDTSLPTPFTVTYSICQTSWTTWSCCMAQPSTLGSSWTVASLTLAPWYQTPGLDMKKWSGQKAVSSRTKVRTDDLTL